MIEIHDLSFTYPSSRNGLHKIHISLRDGESVALVGENGAGKSTLLQHLIGFLTPSSGEISIARTKITPQNIHEIRRHIGMVFQDPDDQLFMPTVFDDVAFGPLNMGFEDAEVQKRVHSSLQRVGVSHLKNRPSHHLSSGEKRLVAIASVLAMSPEILIMDEPSSFLDPRARQRLIDLLQSFSHTKIIATHDLDLAMDVCERTIIIHKGKVRADGPTRDIFNNTELLHHCSLAQPLGFART